MIFIIIKHFLDAISYAKNNQGRVHVFGLVSDGGVHAYPTHIKALFSLKDTHDVPMYLHAFMDGRDTPPQGGKDYLKDLIDQGIEVATVSGRYYAMDRDNNWSRIQASIDAMTIAKGAVYVDPLEGIQASYEQGITDEFIVPFISNVDGQIKNGDAIILQILDQIVPFVSQPHFLIQVLHLIMLVKENLH